jgi:hypothetical protein
MNLINRVLNSVIEQLFLTTVLNSALLLLLNLTNTVLNNILYTVVLGELDEHSPRQCTVVQGHSVVIYYFRYLT